MTEREAYKRALETTLLSGQESLDAILNIKDNLRRTRWRGLKYAAAALLLCIGLAAASPSARAFVLRLLRPADNIAQYLAAPAEVRQAQPLPKLDAALEDAREQQTSFDVTYAANNEWRAWAEGIRPQFDSLLYDGETLYMAGTLFGHAKDLLKPLSEYTQTQNEQGISNSPPGSLRIMAVRYTLGSETRDYDGFALQVSTDNENLARAYESDSLPIALEIPAGAGLAGRQALTLELRFTDMDALRAAGEGLDFPVGAVITVSGLHFDATAGTASIQNLPLPQPVPLKGEAAIFSLEEGDGKASIGKDLLSLEGGEFAVTAIRQRLEGTELTLCITPPAGWTQKQISFLQSYLFAEFIVDGHNMGGFGQAYSAMRYSDGPPRSIVFTVSTSLQPEDWAAMQSLEVLLVLQEMTQFNGAEVPLNNRITVDYGPRGWSEETEPRPLPDCILRIK